MNQPGDRMQKLLADLATQRDELRLQLHLMKAETRDEFEALEKRWQQLQNRLENVGKSVKVSAVDVGAATEQLGEELAKAYRRLLVALK